MILLLAALASLTAQVGTPVDIGDGQSVTITHIDDSRCPEAMSCYQQGGVVISLDWNVSGEAVGREKVYSPPWFRPDKMTPVACVKDKALTVEDVRPPKADHYDPKLQMHVNAIAQQDYRVTLRVESCSAVTISGSPIQFQPARSEPLIRPGVWQFRSTIIIDKGQPMPNPPGEVSSELVIGGTLRDVLQTRSMWHGQKAANCELTSFTATDGTLSAMQTCTHVRQGAPVERLVAQMHGRYTRNRLETRTYFRRVDGGDLRDWAVLNTIARRAGPIPKIPENYRVVANDCDHNQVPDIKGLAYVAARRQLMAAGWTRAGAKNPPPSPSGGLSASGAPPPKAIPWQGSGALELLTCSRQNRLKCSFAFSGNHGETLFVNTHGDEMPERDIHAIVDSWRIDCSGTQQ